MQWSSVLKARSNLYLKHHIHHSLPEQPTLSSLSYKLKEDTYWWAIWMIAIWMIAICREAFRVNSSESFWHFVSCSLLCWSLQNKSQSWHWVRDDDQNFSTTGNIEATTSQPQLEKETHLPDGSIQREVETTNPDGSKTITTTMEKPSSEDKEDFMIASDEDSLSSDVEEPSPESSDEEEK
jgi:hypothetical protein